MEHVALGGSSCPRWVPCPGSVNLCKDIPDKGSAFADEGTAAHTLGEKALKTKKGVSHYLGTKIPVNGKNWEVTPEMVAAVQVYVTAVRLNLVKGRKLWIERSFDLAKLDPRFKGLVMRGTNDACISEPFGKLRVYDLKFGKGVSVEVERNYQLMFYALAAYLELDDDNDEIELVVIQPRKEHPDGYVRRWSLTPEELMEWAIEEMLPAARRSEDADAPLNPGYWCDKYFCAARAQCPALYALAEKTALTDFAETTASDLIAPELMTPEELGAAYAGIQLMKKWASSVEKFLFEELTRGVEIPDVKLIEGRMGNRTWEDPELVEKALAGYGEIIYTKRSLLSVAQMEKAIKAFDSSHNVQGIIGRYISRAPAKPTLAHISHPKPAVFPSVETFEPVDEDLDDLL